MKAVVERSAVAFSVPTVPVVSAALLLFVVLERVLPLRPRTQKAWPRLGINVAIAFSSYLVGQFVVRATTNAIFAWTESKPIGLLHALPLPPPVAAIVGFLLLDWTFYLWHRFAHRSSVVWRFHNVHHYDEDMDVSTAFRFHPGETLLSTAFRAGQALLLGVSLPVYATYELVFQVAVLFHHGNLRLGETWERRVGRVFVTPRMHGMHHSVKRRETDSNYGVVFSFWDQLHGTYCRWSKQNPTMGVPGYARAEDRSFGAAMLAPFRRQRPYWSEEERKDDLGTASLAP